MDDIPNDVACCSERPAFIIGMMSGTSVDTIDAALCELSRASTGRISARVAALHEHPIPALLRRRIFDLFADGVGSLSLACSLNFEIGNAFADAALELMKREGLSPESIMTIASHGQTAYHIAPHMVEPPRRDNSCGPSRVPRLVPSTLQIGESAVIAERTRCRVVSDFRVADMAAGGNGAPLVPFADYHLFSRLGQTVILQNIGGIANCTVLPASGSIGDVIAFDTGPGNMVIDALTAHFYPGQQYDRDGGHARQGTVIKELLDRWMRLPFILAPPPKSTGRELFGVQFAMRAAKDYQTAKPDDLIATATMFTAGSIALNLTEHVFRRRDANEVLLAGGGARNKYLAELITREITDAALSCGITALRVDLLDIAGSDVKSRECAAFAVLGYARLLGIPANVPSATGARHPALLGKITDPPHLR
ncbi:MAG: anhydro-N-acetylmuramic acid kinase, partial [Candidatus Sumerlaeota bacterium]|nr:anhydro-N-acetylmuramic acid kinase [Candidatus Sumerlaeota bacterium]